MVNTLFQREHETLTGEMVDLVNRSQTQLQASIGSPAQADQLGRLSKDVNTHLEALDKRIDAIQLFNQTHSQTLQLQSRAIQSLQDQHATVLATLLPLLPLLQAIPLHIESARTKLADAIAKSCGSPPFSLGSSRTQDRPQAIERKDGHKRSSSTVQSDNSPSPLSTKKPRLMTNTDALRSSGADNGHDITDGGLAAQPVRTSTDLTDPPKDTCVPESPTPSSSTRRGSPTIPSPRSLQPINSGNESRRHTPSARTRGPHSGLPKTTDIALAIEFPGRLDGPAAVLPIASSSPCPSEDVTPSAQRLRPPRILSAHSSKAGSHAPSTSTAAPKDGLRTSQPGEAHSVSKPSVSAVPSIPSYATKDSGPATSRDSKNVDHLSPMTAQEGQKTGQSPHISKLATPSVSSRLPLTFMLLNPSSPRSNGENHSPMLPPEHGPRSGRNTRASTPSVNAPRTPVRNVLLPRNGVSAQPQPFPLSSQLRLLQNGGSTAFTAPAHRPERRIAGKVAIGTMPSIQNVPPAGKVRERRSPFRTGRRFIPLSDSDDDDDLGG
ncbi:hypothetical protein LshimejAT787_1302910 [Lyophyllum shimeji]|uniref:Uncharacterized protein n=1 Tax=Lyophyllum shimeji TaxID=47721 RepID=A0A9P3UTA7_LYOSH|nr:hypothetical protein LshimejAT787_1302910 [Lyophyllum shimeji]